MPAQRASRSESRKRMKPGGRLTLARIVKTQGRRGEVAAQLFTDFPERLAQRREVFLWRESGEPQTARVEKTWFHKHYLVFKFVGVESMEAAGRLVGCEIQIPRSDAAPLPDSTYYIHDLVGCRVVQTGTQEELGTVRDVEQAGGAFRLVVESSQGEELLIPFAQEFCPRIAPAEKLIEVVLPEGLRDLNT